MDRDISDSPSEPVAELLAWASELAQQEIVLEVPVTFAEIPLRMVTTTDASRHALRHLRIISCARFEMEIGGRPPWTPKWWQRESEEAVTALRNLRFALKKVDIGEPTDERR